MNLLDIYGDSLPIIAGPCSAENEQQLLSTAKELAEGGIKILRAGLWKPRTKPGCFEGVGEVGLQWLKKARQLYNIKVVTEVATPAHAEKALLCGVDGVWIGARTATNPFDVQAVADVLRGSNVAVFVKNPVVADIDLWIGAIERIARAGITDITAIHRGFGGSGSGIYRNSPQWYAVMELRCRRPDLKILCDPSHIGGHSNLIEPLSQEALNLGYDGLFIECHINPEKALSDSEQQITPSTLFEILGRLRRHNCNQEEMPLTALRTKLDFIDSSLTNILAQRNEVARQIGEYKVANNMAILQPKRYNEIMQRFIAEGVAHNMSREFLHDLFEIIHKESVAQQLKVMKK